MVLPLAVWNGLWFGVFGAAVGLGLYVIPMVLWLAVSTVIATIETRYSYAEVRTWEVLLRRLARVVPYAVINTGMLPHQFSAFTEGLFGSLHSEFERTPKAATVTAGAGAGQATRSNVATEVQGTRRPKVKVHRPYVVAELFFAFYQFTWFVLFVDAGMWTSAIAAGFVGACVAGLMWFYGDHVGRRLFVVPAPGAMP